MADTSLLRKTNLGLSEKSTQVQQMFDRIAPRYDILNRLLSARQDTRWRNALVSQLPKCNSHGVLYDVACGTGDVLFQVEKKRRDYNSFTGFDISQKMLECAGERALAKNKNFAFVEASAEKLPAQSDTANAVSISFGLRNVDDRQRALSEFYRVLQPGGKLFVLEFFEAENSLFSKVFNFYFNHVLPRIAGLISDRAAYEYLPRSVASMPVAPEFRLMLIKSGFSDISETRWIGGAARLFVGIKPGLPVG